MPQFQYKVKRAPDDIATGVLEAESQRAAISRLRDMGYFPISVEEYTEEGQKQIQETIAYYMRNAKIIREGLTAAGITVFGGVDAPYIWLKVPAGMDSWTFFDRLLDECHIVGTPGSGFGPSGEGYFRLTAFNTLEKTEQAVERIRNWKI